MRRSFRSTSSAITKECGFDLFKFYAVFLFLLGLLGYIQKTTRISEAKTNNGTFQAGAGCPIILVVVLERILCGEAIVRLKVL